MSSDANFTDSLVMPIFIPETNKNIFILLNVVALHHPIWLYSTSTMKSPPLHTFLPLLVLSVGHCWLFVHRYQVSRAQFVNQIGSHPQGVCDVCF